MKKKMSVIKRLRVCFTFFKLVDSNFLGEYCPFCGSHRIKATDKSIDFNKDKSKSIYSATYICMKCGARANTTEYWDK